MFAVIIQSSLPGGAVQQVAVIPTDIGSATPLVFSRIAGGRGANGAWSASEPVYGLDERVHVGTPVARRITDSDIAEFAHGGVPTTLLQKLVRACKPLPPVKHESDTLGETVARVRAEAIDGNLLGQYVSAPTGFDVSRPVTHVALPPVPTAQVAPAPVAPSVPSVSSSDVLHSTLLIPTAQECAGYIERTLAGGMSERQVYEFARANQQTVAIYGHAGTGKTSSARHIASAWGVPFVQFECNAQVDEESVQGTFIPTGDPDRPLVWKYSELATAISQPSVILINESNRMPAKNAALFLGLLQERKLQVTRHRNEVIEVHPDCLIVTDANPGYRGTQASDQAFLDRLNIPVVFQYDREIEKHFIPSPTLLDLATQMRIESEAEDKWGVPVSTRLLKNFVLHARGLNLAFAIEAFVTSFPTDEERSALRILLEADSANIAQELGVTA